MWQIAAAGDRALLVTISSVIEPAVLAQVLSLDRALQERRPHGLISTLTAYGSLLCHYDPAVIERDGLAGEIRAFEGRLDASVPTGSVVAVPVRYEGPDLAEVAAKTNLTAAAVLELHAGHLRPLIDKAFPFDETLEALAYLEQGRANGKVVITLD